MSHFHTHDASRWWLVLYVKLKLKMEKANIMALMQMYAAAENAETYSNKSKLLDAEEINVGIIKYG